MSRPETKDRKDIRRATPGIRTKIYVRDDMVGGGKIVLLCHIRAAGSLSGAATAMGVSEARARFLLDTLQRCFETPLVAPTTTGVALTPFGDELIARFERHSAEVAAASAPFLAWLEGHQRR